LVSSQQGVIDCVKEPVELQRQILHGILKSTGCQEDEDQILIIPETDIQRRWHSVHALRHHQVAAVGHTIVSTARQYIRNELEQAMEKVRRTLPDDADDAQQVAAFLRDDQVVFWDQARLRLEGESATPQPWQYVIVPSSSPNAFVTEILPRKFFITTSMLERIATSPDELAVVLAHETAHLILGHVSSTNKVETALRTIEVLLLSMDPTAGVLSVFVMGLLFAIRKMITAAHSRENEMQADDLGLVLAGKACYDIIRGVQVMYKMHQADGAAAAVLVPSSATSADTKIVRQPSTSQATPDLLPAPIGTPAILRLMDTHPPSLERYQRMKEQAEHAHHPECASLTTKLWNAMWSATTATTRNPTAKEQ
jgi:Zn-dependent protease with chaperone function